MNIIFDAERRYVYVAPNTRTAAAVADARTTLTRALSARATPSRCPTTARYIARMPATTIDQLRTPCLVLDAERMHHNIAVLRAHLHRLGVPLRAHVKTCKSLPALLGDDRRRTRAGHRVDVGRGRSLLRANGFRDILYAVGLAPNKLDAVAVAARSRLRPDRHRRQPRCRPARCRTPAGHPGRDRDRQRRPPRRRATRRPGATADRERTRRRRRELRGVMTHAGASYECRGEAALVAMGRTRTRRRRRRRRPPARRRPRLPDRQRRLDADRALRPPARWCHRGPRRRVRILGPGDGGARRRQRR